MASEEFLTRNQVLGGLVARRARTLLFLVESRTAQLVARSQAAMDPLLTEQAEQRRDLAFLEAFALGREPPLRPTIQDLEHHAPQWADLIPDNPNLRAAVAHFLGAKYRFTAQSVPHLRAALGLDAPAVQRAYLNLYSEPLETIFIPSVTLLDHLRWGWSALAGWFEALPPFWTVFSLTLTETVGAGILALPIALARVGPLAGVGVLIALGLLNMLSVAALAESVARTGSIRYGNVYFGRLVSEYLGAAAAWVATLATTTINAVSVLAYYLGFSSVLSAATGLRAEVWVGALFLIGLFFLSRGSLSSTIASALAIGLVIIGLILVLSVLTAAHSRPDNLRYVNLPFLGGRPFDPALLGLIFGVVLLTCFGHMSVGNCGKLVLRRDPSGRSSLFAQKLECTRQVDSGSGF